MLKRKRSEQEERTVDPWLLSTTPLPSSSVSSPMASGASDTLNSFSGSSTSGGGLCVPNSCTSAPANGGSSGSGTTTSGSQHAAPCDWQVMKQKVHERGQHLLETGQWSDCKFIVGTEPHQQVFEGHKVFLAMSSPVFEAMFFGGMAEKEGPIQILDVQPEGFKALLEYVYSDKISLRSFDQACELCYVAKKYMLPHLVRECTTYIWRDIRSDNACRAYEFAKLFEEPALMEKSLEVIRDQTKAVLAEPSFEEVELATVQAILDQDELNIDSELELFDALQRWAVRECARKGLAACDDKALRSVLHGTVGKIRFLTLSPSQFAERPAVSQLLSQDEAFAILVNISSPASAALRPLPQGFTTSRISRKKVVHEAALAMKPATLVNNIVEGAAPKIYCTRNPSPDQQPETIHNSTILDSTVTFTVDHDICILGVQIPTQVLMDPMAGCHVNRREPFSYTELLYAHLLDSDGSRLTYTHFTSRVEYATLMEINFNRFTFIQRNKVYRVGVVLNKPGCYPSEVYGETEHCDGVKFKFNVGNPLDSVRDGLIHSIVFRHM